MSLSSSLVISPLSTLLLLQTLPTLTRAPHYFKLQYTNSPSVRHSRNF